MRYFLVIGALALLVILLVLVAKRSAAPGAHSPAPPSTADRPTIYYIDSASGDDANDGLGADAAWKTLARLDHAPLLPGSSIMLRRGGVWREPLNLTTSGEAGAPLTYGSYGEGEKPSIRASDDYSAPGDWRYESEGCWYVDDIRTDPGMVFHDEAAAVRRKEKDALADPWDFWYDELKRRVYVRLDANPAGVATRIEIPIRGIAAGPRGASHLRLTGLDFRHGVETTLLLWESDHVELEDCSFSQSPGTHVQVGQGSNYARIVGCLFDDWNMGQGRGYAVQSEGAGSGPVDVERCAFNATQRGGGEDHTAVRSDDKGWIRSVRECRFEGNGGSMAGDGVSVFRPSAAASTVTIEDNVFEELGGRGIVVEALDNYGGSLAVSIQRNRLARLCLRDEPDQDAIQARGFPSGRATVLIAANLIAGTLAGQHPHGGIAIQEARGLRIVHNGVRDVDDGIALRFGSVEPFVANNILVKNRGAGLRADSGGATCLHNAYFENANGPTTGISLSEGDLDADLLVDEHLRPLAGSPCIDGGLDAGLTNDLERRRAPSGAGPDIGPYEFSPAAP